ncbi:probable serine/threonine-protein kinase [Tanacetum coccineum]
MVSLGHIDIVELLLDAYSNIGKIYPKRMMNVWLIWQQEWVDGEENPEEIIELDFLEIIWKADIKLDGFKEFELTELRAATNQFSRELNVSESGEKVPNMVCIGKLKNNKDVAIKRFPKLSWPEPQQFVGLTKLSQKFDENVLDATKKIEKLIIDKREIKGFPATSLGLAAQTTSSKGHENATAENGRYIRYGLLIMGDISEDSKDNKGPNNQAHVQEV